MRARDERETDFQAVLLVARDVVPTACGASPSEPTTRALYQACCTARGADTGAAFVGSSRARWPPTRRPGRCMRLEGPRVQRVHGHGRAAAARVRFALDGARAVNVSCE